MLVNSTENSLLTSTEHNKAGPEFVLFNQKHNKTHYRENIEKKYEKFKSAYSSVQVENCTVIKDRALHASCVVMDSNQPLVKVASKRKVLLITSK